MADDSLILEILRKLQTGQANIEASFRDVQHRMTALEHNQAQTYAAFANQSSRLDRIEERLERIERRLELREDSI